MTQNEVDKDVKRNVSLLSLKIAEIRLKVVYLKFIFTSWKMVYLLHLLIKSLKHQFCTFKFWNIAQQLLNFIALLLNYHVVIGLKSTRGDPYGSLGS